MEDFENYEEVGYLGSGSQGDAILVRYKPTDEQYVLKRIMTTNMVECQLEKVALEAEALRKCSHANVIKYITQFQDDDYLNIVMEYANGGDLTDQIELRRRQGQQFSDDEVRSYAIQIMQALIHIHSLKIIHRDVKPENVFLHEENGITVLKLADFGVAKPLTQSQDMTFTKIGTPNYIAAEILLDPDAKYGCEADIWSLGCLVYELCAMRVPFKAGNNAQFLQQLIKGEYPPVNRPPDITKVISLALQKDPKLRPSAKQLLKILNPTAQSFVQIQKPPEEPNVSRVIASQQVGLESREQLELQQQLVTLCTGRKFMILCRHTGLKVWDVCKNSMNTGAEIINYDQNNGNNQKFYFQMTKAGLLITVSSTMMKIGVKNNDTRLPIIQSNNTLFHCWELEHAQQGQEWFYVRLAKSDLYITLEEGCRDNFARFILGELTYGFHQMFKFQ